MIDFDWSIMTQWSGAEPLNEYGKKICAHVMGTSYASLVSERYYIEFWD